MAKTRGRAGRNIRKLAFSRRFKAVYSFIAAGFAAYLPFALAALIGVFRELVVDISPEINDSPAIPPILYVVAMVLSLCLVANGIFLWKRASHADQGARGEEETAQELNTLADEGWQVEYGKRLGKGVGDIDIICTSPKGKTYVIDVKSHKGSVYTDGKKLHRCMGKNQYPFEKDFLAQVTKQALQVKKKTGKDFVTPVIAFSDARVVISSSKVKHVYVAEKSRLVSLLRSLG